MPYGHHTSQFTPIQFVRPRTTIAAVGDRFGRLVVTGVPHSRAMPCGLRHVYYPCRCDCGADVFRFARLLRPDAELSCGCVGTAARLAAVTIHNRQPLRLYRIWNGMKQRCGNVLPERNRSYGGRGIKVCREWNESFVTFRDWGIANGYRDDLSIERDDVNGNYEPSNCRWIPLGEQGKNRRHTRRLTAFGETKLLIQWVVDPRCAISETALAKRLKKGWDAERAIASPRSK